MARDWNRRHCARRGHETYAPSGSGTDALLHERLHSETVHGEAWRCLRCGDFVIGEAKNRGPAELAPTVLRGRALRDHFILRVLAVERILRGVLIFLIAYAVWKFSNNQDALRKLFEDDITALKPFASKLGYYNLDHATVVDRIRHFFGYKPKTLHIASAALAGYALLETVEGIGLWMTKRWGEYLTAVGTSIFLPLEIWDGYNKIHEHKSWVLAACTFAINVGAVVYLLVTKRLFGIRGGGKAFEAAKHAESLLAAELAACGVPAARTEGGVTAPAAAPATAPAPPPAPVTAVGAGVDPLGETVTAPAAVLDVTAPAAVVDGTAPAAVLDGTAPAAVVDGAETPITPKSDGI